MNRSCAGNDPQSRSANASGAVRNSPNRTGSTLVRSSGVGYSILVLLSLGIAGWQGRLAEIFRFPGWAELAVDSMTGAGLAAAVLSISRVLRSNFRWARQLEAEFEFLLGPLSSRDAWMLATMSGFSEEIFFRVTLQPVLGLWVTSFGFGLLHYPSNRRMVPWTFMATVLGIAFGVVYDWTESLLAVALAHGLINLVELRSLARAPLARGAGERT